MTYDIKTKTSDKCRIYPDNHGSPAPSVTSISGCLMKFGLIQWAADEAVKYICKTSDVDDPRLYESARFAYKNISDEAKQAGTDIHAICEAYLRSYHDEEQGAELDKLLRPLEEAWGERYSNHMFQPIDFAIEVSNAAAPLLIMFRNFKAWCEKNQIEPVHIEQVVHGDGYSGRVDLIAYRTAKGVRRLGLYDIKTGKGSYYPEWGLQLGGYAEAFEYFEQESAADYDHVFEAREIEEIGIIKLNKETLKANFSEDRGPKYTQDRERLTRAFLHLKDFYWEFNDLEKQFAEIKNGPA